MRISDALKLENGQPVNLEAVIEKIFPPKKVAKNGSSFVIQEVVLKDGRDSINFSTLEEIAPANIGKKALITGTTSHWKGRDRVLHKSLRGKLEIIGNGNGGNGKDNGKHEQRKPEVAKVNGAYFPSPANEFEQRDLWIATQSSLKTAAELIRGIVPFCKDMKDLPAVAEQAKDLMLRFTAEFVEHISGIKAENSVAEIRKMIEQEDIPENTVDDLLDEFDVTCTCELSDDQRGKFVKRLKELQTVTG